ncbi:hypothetical protein VV869_14855 [Photobacterium sp. MCCC 1A19761]|uniref:hypothetical protein n=1 Tax=Photobacterium sp. MCCC 1A19761 TaxID=3115000 RepID=UPI00307E49B0
MNIALPNLYKQNTQQFIQSMKSLPFPFPGKKWDDMCWVKRWVNFSRKEHRYNDRMQEAKLLPQPYRDLVGASLVFLKSQWGLSYSSLNEWSDGFKLLYAALEAEGLQAVWQFDQRTYDAALNILEVSNESHTTKASRNTALNFVVRFLSKSRLRTLNNGEHRYGPVLALNQSIQIETRFDKDYSYLQVTPEGDQSRRDKMPDNYSLYAAADIYNKVMPGFDADIDPFENVRDRFVSAYLSLTLCAPQRVAETVLLDRWSLTKKTVSENRGGVRYQVDTSTIIWRGSKNYPDHEKVVLDKMMPIADRSFYYLEKSCEPGRILVRFYEHPETPLQDLLKDTQFSNTSAIKHHKLKLKKPPTLWQLGGILGVYDDLPKDHRLHNIPGFPYRCKLDHPLNKQDIYALFGIKTNLGAPEIVMKAQPTLQGVQAAWIAYIKSSVENFPYRIHNNGKKVHLADALMVFTGKQLAINQSGFNWGKSPLAIESIGLQMTFYSALSGKSKTDSIFKKHGYPNASLVTHGPRHYLNTKALQGGMQETTLEKWSGRASHRHTRAYDHRTMEEKHMELLAFCESEVKDIQVRIVDEKTFEEATGVAAHRMLTGYCVQPLYLEPCERANQCIGCKQICHVKGDKQDLSILRADEAIQSKRLEIATREDSPRSKRWRKIHGEKLTKLKALITVFTDDSIERGAIIRFKGEDETLLITNAANTLTEEYLPRLEDRRAGEPETSRSLPAPVDAEQDDLAEMNALFADLENACMPDDAPLENLYDSED